MNVLSVLHRLIGLLAFACKSAFTHGKVGFDRTLLASPFVRIYVGHSSRLNIGKRVVVGYGSDFCAVDGGSIRIGNRVYLGPRCMLSAHEDVSIGDDCLFGPDVKLFDNNHEFNEGRGVVMGCHRSSPITVGKNVWLGANVIVLRGVSIGDGAVIGAGSVIRRNVPAGAVVRGSQQIDAQQSGLVQR